MADLQRRSGTIRTPRPERYASQLAKHWSGRAEAITEADSTTTMRMDTGNVVVMRARQTVLEVDVLVPPEVDVDVFAQVVKEHLERFGQRENLELVWN